jgi:putative ABC transport system permease protein
MTWYLFESALTAGVGGLAGLLLGVGFAWILTSLIPTIESFTSPFVIVEAMAMALAVGIGAGVAPAMRAAAMDPVEALRAE